MNTRSVTTLIRKYNAGKDEERVEDKYRMMSASAFRFFRGSCHVFYHDLLHSSVIINDPTRAWVCGDLHMENFGVYTGDTGLHYFDINDFDESTLAPVTYDLTRFLTSLFLSSGMLEKKGANMTGLAEYFLQQVTAHLRNGKARVQEQPSATGLVLAYFEQIAQRTKKEFYSEWLVEKGGQIRLKKSNPRIKPIAKELRTELLDLFEPTKAQISPTPFPALLDMTPDQGKKSSQKTAPIGIEALDAAFRLAGTGSMGLERYVVVVKMQHKIRLLDLKRSQAPSIDLYRRPVYQWSNEGERISAVQKMVQAIPPALLQSIPFHKKEYVLKELQVVEDKLDLVKLNRDKIKVMELLEDMALITASAYLRSAGWKNSSTIDDLQRFGSQTDWQKPVLNYAKKYSVQVQKDYEVFKKAFLSGRLK